MTTEQLRIGNELTLKIDELSMFLASIGSSYRVAEHGCGKSREVNEFVYKTLVEEKQNVKKKVERKLLQLRKDFNRL